MNYGVNLDRPLVIEQEFNASFEQAQLVQTSTK